MGFKIAIYMEEWKVETQKFKLKTHMQWTLKRRINERKQNLIRILENFQHLYATCAIPVA